MFDLNLRRQQVEEIYREVVKSFPIKEDEIRIKYNFFWHGIAGYASLNIINKKEPVIWIGNRFFRFSELEQEGITAHEIEHHEIMKGYSIPRLQRHDRWIGMYEQSQRMLFPHWEERLEKWYILCENAVNNEVAKTKYGRQLLEAYKTRLSRHDEFDELTKKRKAKKYEIIQILAANLEQKLGIK